MLLNEGESLQSYFFRTKLLYGQDDLRKSSRCIMESSSFKWRQLFACQVHYLRQALADSEYEELLINEHTVLPIYRPLMGIPEYLKIVSGIYNEREIKAGVNIYFYGYRNLVTSLVKFCPDCLQKHIENQGYIWFKARWLIPTIDKCKVHGRRLLQAKCTQCSRQGTTYLGRMFGVFEGRCASCSASLLDSKNCHDVCTEGYNLDYAKFDDEVLLDKKYPFLSRELVVFLINHAYQNFLDSKFVDASFERIFEFDPDAGAIHKFLHNKAKYVQHTLFWTLMYHTFKELSNFEDFLYEHSQLRLNVHSIFIGGRQQEFLLEELILK
ncbi:MAG: TniQ family protein [Pseudomonadota bacterium]|nr:TniQ family protein [Pseudomonadota bacterium]